MDFQSIAKVSPKGHLPEELCCQILSRLPVKSLLRFCCVSKSWLSLIKDPEFRHLHLLNFKNNHDETHLLVVQGRSRDCVVRWSDNFQINSPTLLSLGEKYRRESWSIKCSIDGLVLLASSKGLRIWNPSIRKFHDIPRSPKNPNMETTRIINCYRETVIGFGYDAVVKDYKYVKILNPWLYLLKGNPSPLVVVYTLGAGSWKIIPFQAKEGDSDSDFDFDFDSGFSLISDTVYLQGNLYFVLHPEGECKKLGWFDVSSEVFCSISFPENIAGWHSDPDWCGFVKLVRSGGSSLALMINDGRSLAVSVFDSESMLWTECYDSGLVVRDFLYLKKNRDILMWWSVKEGSFSLAASESLEHEFSLISSCNLDTNKERIMLIQEADGVSVRCGYEVYGYYESLVLLK